MLATGLELAAAQALADVAVPITYSGVVVFEDPAAFTSAIPKFTAVGFDTVGADGSTIAPNAFTSVGLLLDGNDTVEESAAFPADGFGAVGNDTFSLAFAEPISAIAFDFPGRIGVTFFVGPVEIAGTYVVGEGGIGQYIGFFGLEFDRVEIEPIGSANAALDTVYYPQIIPAPGGCAIAALAGIAMFRRRR